MSGTPANRQLLLKVAQAKMRLAGREGGRQLVPGYVDDMAPSEEIHDEANAIGKLYDAALDENLQQAEAGSSAAKIAMAIRYKNGKGVDKDPKQMLSYFKQAAEMGSGMAERMLGILYLNGEEGINRDIKQAIVLLKKAAAKGHAEALNALGVCYEDGQGVPIDLNKAMEYYVAGSDLGHKKSMQHLLLLFGKRQQALGPEAAAAALLKEEENAKKQEQNKAAAALAKKEQNKAAAALKKKEQKAAAKEAARVAAEAEAALEAAEEEAARDAEAEEARIAAEAEAARVAANQEYAVALAPGLANLGKPGLRMSRKRKQRNKSTRKN